ncbi:hypothetical protein EYC84_005550 [Monilinia fructicola]|uniref:Uncharacterized protein n=1 Tax=Monilinia fructicola TaxID=38448 RepID=A0A5M9JWU0_MONFR|nr:hypothetical protein EYC84_005550 [Monilinia fructicola]
MEGIPTLPTSSTTITSTPSSIILPSKTQRQRPRSRPISPVWDRLIFPYTLEDWKVIMDEIKKLYLSRQYQQCTARCIQILDSITDPYRVHPLNSLFLSFYCATSLEITASNLHNNSPQKLSLLRDSLSYFQRAEEYITYADIPIENNNLTTANRSSSISSTSSARSSVDSVFSTTSFPSTTDGLSPVFSTCSFEDDDENTPTHRRTYSESSTTSTQSTATTATTATTTTLNKSAPLRIKKKVSFSPALPTLISAQNLEIDSTIYENIPRAMQSPTAPPRPIISSKYQSPSPAHPSLNTCLTNYNLNLSSLTIQLTYHITHINKLIDTIQNVRKSRRSNQASFAPSLFNSSGDLNTAEKEEMSRKDIRERIDKLKSAGWQRKRWDGSRYEALREKVDNELNGWI